MARSRLGREEDPYERVNVYGNSPGCVADLKRRLEQDQQAGRSATLLLSHQ